MTEYLVVDHQRQPIGFLKGHELKNDRIDLPFDLPATSATSGVSNFRMITFTRLSLRSKRMDSDDVFTCDILQVNETEDNLFLIPRSTFETITERYGSTNHT